MSKVYRCQNGLLWSYSNGIMWVAPVPNAGQTEEWEVAKIIIGDPILDVEHHKAARLALGVN